MHGMQHDNRCCYILNVTSLEKFLFWVLYGVPKKRMMTKSALKMYEVFEYTSNTLNLVPVE